MNRLLAVTVVAAGLLPGVSPALEITNILPRYGPYGAVRADRADMKCLPKDVIVVTYDISGLNVNPKTGKAKYTTTLELLDSKDKVIFSKQTPNEPILQLGGGKMPGDLFVTVGDKQAPGKYKIRLTVTDQLDPAKNAGKQFEYPYEVLAPKFGFAQVAAPAVGVTGDRYVTSFFLMNSTLDKKSQPKGEVNIRVLDEKGKEVDAVKYSLPSDLPPGIDLSDANVVPFQHPIYLNRAGRFTIEVTAEDKLGSGKLEMRYPLTVIDINSIAK